MIWSYDDSMIWWHHDMMIWRYDDMMIWWYDDMMIWIGLLKSVRSQRLKSGPVRSGPVRSGPVVGPRSVRVQGSAEHRQKYKIFAIFVAFFSEVFLHFCEVFAGFSKFSDPFGPVRTHSDLFRCIRILSEVFWCFPKKLQNFGNLKPFEMFWNVFRRFRQQ